MERVTEFEPAWDRRSKEPSKNHGVHGVTMRMVLKGVHGAVSFVVYTNWHLQSVQKDMDAKTVSAIADKSSDPYTMLKVIYHPLPAGLDYHSPTPMYEGQTFSQEYCPYVGGKCYCDGSGLTAQDVFATLVNKGSEAVWKYLEEYYTKTFGELK